MIYKYEFVNEREKEADRIELLRKEEERQARKKSGDMIYIHICICIHISKKLRLGQISINQHYNVLIIHAFSRSDNMYTRRIACTSLTGRCLCTHSYVCLPYVICFFVYIEGAVCGMHVIA
jgi:hypothetical protein